MIAFRENDGGRAAAGFKGQTGDCGVRAVAIATDLDYRFVYDELNGVARAEKLSRGRRSSARTGIYRETMHRFMQQIGATWTPTMGIGTGCRVHVRADELPGDSRLVLSLSKHYAAFVDGVLHDTYDCSRDGTRCVYGYWTMP